MSNIKLDSINTEVNQKSRIAIAGHVRPDGDCIGSCTALYLYLIENKAELGIDRIDVYLEPFGNEFRILQRTEDIMHSYEQDLEYDLFISLDCASQDRLGNAIKYFQSAKRTLNIDHHISNTLFAEANHIVADASSTCEVLFELIPEDKVSLAVAECIYVGLIHDTGGFKHTNTSRKTLTIAGKLIEKGVPFSKLLDETFYSRTYMQTQLLGRCLMESMLLLDGKIIVSSISLKVLDFYEAQHSDLDGIIDQLRATKGTEVAVFIYETKPQEYKVSMRSNGEVNVSKIAVYFGGGGHIKAAGCTMHGSAHDVICNIAKHIEAQLKHIEA